MMKTIQQVKKDLDRLLRFVEEAEHSVALQVAGGLPVIVADLLAAPAEMQELREDRDSCRAQKRKLQELAESLEDVLTGQAYADGLIDGKNAPTRERQVREALRESETMMQSRQNLVDTDRRLAEAERELRAHKETFAAKLAILRFARAEIEWLSWL